MIRTVFTLFLTLNAIPVVAQDVRDREKYLIAQPGTVPVIVSAPHGGRTPLAGVPNRTGDGAAKFVVVLDTNTAELAEKLAAAIEAELGGRPYLVIAKFERKQVDPNRPPHDAFESPAAKPYYDAYHAALQQYATDIRQTWGRGLLLDVHGQAADANAIFVGTQNRKTVSALTARFGLKAFTGRDGIPGALAAQGYTLIPDPAGPTTVKEDPRFGGGYIVGTYGSDAGTGIDAIQLEFGGNARAIKALSKTAADVAAAVKRFHAAYLPSNVLPTRHEVVPFPRQGR